MFHQSPHARVEIPRVGLAQLVVDAARAYPNRTALIDGVSGRTLTYSEFVDAMWQVAASLTQRGLRKGDVLGICSSNSPDYVVAVYGAATAGIAVTPINPQHGLAELTHQLRDAGASALMTTPSLASKTIPASKAAGVREIIELGTTPHLTSPALTRSMTASSAVDIDPEVDAAVIPYSSATTGSPKGVIATHRNLVTSAIQTQAVECFGAQDTAIAIVPFHHIYGLSCVLNTMLYAGGCIVTLPEFDVRQFLTAVSHYGVTTAYVVPPIVRTLSVHPLVDQYDVSTLAQVCSAAAPLPESVAAACAQRLGCVVKQAYGLTEACGFVHLNPRHAAKPASVGLALPNTEFCVVDVISKGAVPDGELGEVWIRGPQVMAGYLGNADATSQLIDRDGWLHTGDIGFADTEGYLYVMDRAKDLVKFRGLQYRDDELLLSMVEEVSSRRRAEERLQFQALMLENVRESIVVVDEHHRVTFWNPGAEQLFGYTANEAAGKSIQQLMGLDDPDAAAQWSDELAALEREGQWKGQARRRRKDGTVLWADVVVAAVLRPGVGRTGWMALHRDITELRRHQDMLEDSNQRLQSLAARLMDIREDERAEIARELHDELGQSLARLKLDLRWLFAQLPADLLVPRVAAMAPMVDGMLRTVQDLSFELRPAILDDLGLDAAIEWQAREFERWHGCRCTIDVQLSALPRNEACGTVVFRILQECLMNVARHAGASGVSIVGRVDARDLIVQVRDNGIGIRADALTSSRSLGLLGMRERARGIGGSLEINRVTPRGTEVTLRVPLAQRATQGASVETGEPS